MSVSKAAKVLLDVSKDQFDNVFRTKESLDSKNSIILTLDGIVATL